MSWLYWNTTTFDVDQIIAVISVGPDLSYLSKYVEARRKLKDVANNYILINCGNMNVDNNDNNHGNRDDEMQMFKESIVQLMCAGADTIKRIVDASNSD